MSGDATLTVVGIGADGWPGLGERAREAVLSATLLVGSTRQLELVPSTVAERRPWPSPIDSLLEELVAGTTGPTCVLASGDPMLYGIGATLARRVDPARLVVHPHVSAFALACARLGWPEAETELVTTVGRPVETVARFLQPGRRLVLFVSGAEAVSETARILREHDLGPSCLAVLENLGGPEERITESTADEWGERRVNALHVVGVECRAGAKAHPRPRTPGLDDDAYESDGQLTKREVRAVTLASLGPLPGELLWDVGAGSGSIGIEWLRAEPTARAVAVERDPERAERIRRNARGLGVPELDVCVGEAPAALDRLEPPDAVFVGGGLTTPGLLDRCWAALRPGGRLVANAVTLEGEQVLLEAARTYGGRRIRLSVSRVAAVGGFTTWRPQLPVVQWAARKERA